MLAWFPNCARFTIGRSGCSRSRSGLAAAEAPAAGRTDPPSRRSQRRPMTSWGGAETDDGRAAWIVSGPCSGHTHPPPPAALHRPHSHNARHQPAHCPLWASLPPQPDSVTDLTESTARMRRGGGGRLPHLCRIPPAVLTAHSYSAGLITSSICRHEGGGCARACNCMSKWRGRWARTQGSDQCRAAHLAPGAACRRRMGAPCLCLCLPPARALRIILHTCVASISCCFLPISVSNTFCRGGGEGRGGCEQGRRL